MMSILLIILPVILLSVLGLGRLSGSFVAASAQQHLTADEISAANAIERWDHYFALTLENLRSQPDIVGMDPEDQRPILYQTKKAFDRVDALRVTRADGVCIARTDGQAPTNFSDRPWFKACMSGQMIARQTLFLHATSRPSVNVSVPIVDSAGVTLGVLSAVTGVSTLAESVAQAATDDDQQTLVVDDKGQALVDPDIRNAKALIDLAKYPPVQMALSGTEGDITFNDDSGTAWFAHAARLTNGWVVVSQIPQAVVQARTDSMMNIACTVGVLAIAMLAICTWLIATRLVRPIGDLTSAANDLARGVWSRRVHVSGNDELGSLAKAFNRMAEHVEVGYHHIEDEVRKRTAELEQANTTLKSSRESADAANRSKTEFLANMSHEIRTPISAIVGFTDMMLDPGQTNSDRLDSLQVIRRNAQHLLELINNILDLSKIEAGKMRIEQVECDLPNMLASVVSMMGPRAAEKNLQLHVIPQTPIPRIINTDPLRLRQILVNLVGNAIKFTQQGHIELRAAVEPNERGQAIRFSIADTGIGMSTEQAANLFQPFTQADGSTTRRFGGTGLGLSISKRFVEMLGGEIGLTSAPDQGTTFTFFIMTSFSNAEMVTQLNEVTEPESQANLPLPTLRGNILLVEDGVDNQRFIAAMLRRAGAEVGIADNGKIAVDLVQRQNYDLIFMDMQMPEMDGYQATEEMRRLGFLTPIIAITAHAMAEDEAKCIRAGCSAYLTKPIDRRKLLEMAAQYLPQSSPAAVPHPAPATRAGSNATADEIVSTFASDPDMTEIINEFVAALPEKVNDIRRLIGENNLDTLKHTVHQLKGSGGSYGFEAITTAAAAAEAPLRAGRGLDDARADLESMIQLLRRVHGYDPARETSTPSAS